MSTATSAPGAQPGTPALAGTRIEQLRRSGQLPSPKGVALAVMDICSRDDATIDAIARVVQTDPALSGRLLRLANAASMAGGRPVLAIPEAISRLGMAAVRQVAMAFSLVNEHRDGPCKGFDYPRFWSHSLLMAVGMQALAGITRVGSPPEMFACGLMARIGCLALATVHPLEYAELLSRHDGDRGASLAVLERQHLQVDHNEFTATILADCGMPKAVIEPVVHHENPQASGFAQGTRQELMAQLLHHAMRLADMGLAPQALRGAMIPGLMLLGGKLGLDADELGTLVDRVVADWREWGAILEVPSAALPPFATMAAAQAPKDEAQQALNPGMRVLLVEDEPTTRVKMEAVLESIVGHPVHSAGNGREALALALEVMPQIVVTDWLMPVMDGLEFCRALRATEWGQSMYVIMLTGVDTEEEVVRAFEAGVDDYVTKPVNLRALRARMRAALHYVQLLEAWERDRAQLKQFAAELAISNRKLAHHAMTDLLTGLPNRRAGIETLGRAWSAASRGGQALSVMMVDIDRFKSVNDTHGHAVGDRVLVDVGAVIRDCMRRHDHVSRLGGEEFLVILPNTGLDEARQAAERLRRAVRSASIAAGDVKISPTVSVGLAHREGATDSPDHLVAAADRALYAAKQRGRDRVCASIGGRLADFST